ncbi:hypothetical protein EYF80_025252 [Liparis tanakae]|uniref:Uncharacterized protein n=1 Tax=Liparis tanakae TaxID=230148 RepID=A0A4Z2HHX1_9TELE|nr:hypothetical protein EYF80_025252 [Liparis tanakae]
MPQAAQKENLYLLTVRDEAQESDEALCAEAKTQRRLARSSCLEHWDQSQRAPDETERGGRRLPRRGNNTPASCRGKTARMDQEDRSVRSMHTYSLKVAVSVSSVITSCRASTVMLMMPQNLSWITLMTKRQRRPWKGSGVYHVNGNEQQGEEEEERAQRASVCVGTGIDASKVPSAQVLGSADPGPRRMKLTEHEVWQLRVYVNKSILSRSTLSASAVGDGGWGHGGVTKDFKPVYVCDDQISMSENRAAQSRDEKMRCADEAADIPFSNGSEPRLQTSE